MHKKKRTIYSWEVLQRPYRFVKGKGILFYAEKTLARALEGKNFSEMRNCYCSIATSHYDLSNIISLMTKRKTKKIYSHDYESITDIPQDKEMCDIHKLWLRQGRCLVCPIGSVNNLRPEEVFAV